MGTIAALSRACKALDIRETAERAVTGTAMFIINYNQRQLYESSLRADGQHLNLYRNAGYAIQKNHQNPKPGIYHPDLYLTGAFYGAFFVKVQDFEYEVDSHDSKSRKLKGMFGDTIFGLTDESKAEYTKKEFFNTMKRIIESRTGLIFR